MSSNNSKKRIRQGIAGPGGGLFLDHPATISDLQPVIEESLRLGIYDFEGAPLYGYGEQERNYGLVCETLSPQVRSTLRYWGKIGRGVIPKLPGMKSSQPDGLWNLAAPASSLVERWCFGYEEALLIIASSISQTRTAHIHGLVLHDPPDAMTELGIDFETYWHLINHGSVEQPAAKGSLQAALEAQQAGFVSKIGVGCKEVGILRKLLEKSDRIWNVFSVTQYSLMFQKDVLDISPQLERLGIELHILGPYAGGILSDDPRKKEASAIFCNYRPATELEITRARKMWDIAEHFGFESLRPIAMQFVAANPAVHTIVMGPRNPREVQENYRNLNHVEIPAKLWQMLRDEKIDGEPLISPSAPLPQ